MEIDHSVRKNTLNFWQQADAVIKEYDEIITSQQQKTGQVNVKHFQTVAVIGKGSYGKVLLVQKKDTGKNYALKILKKDEIIKRN